MVPDYEHDAHVHRSRDGWQRWHADCLCGWRWTGVGGKQDAERAARAHDGGRLEHTCYDPVTMEYNPDPGPCPACVGEPVNPPATEQSAAAEIGEYLTEQLPPDEPTCAACRGLPVPHIHETEAERTARIHARDAADSYRHRWGSR